MVCVCVCVCVHMHVCMQVHVYVVHCNTGTTKVKVGKLILIHFLSKINFEDLINLHQNLLADSTDSLSVESILNKRMNTFQFILILNNRILSCPCLTEHTSQKCLLVVKFFTHVHPSIELGSL